MKTSPVNNKIEVDGMKIQKIKNIAESMQLSFEDTLLSLFSKVVLRWRKKQNLEVEVMENLVCKHVSFYFSNDLDLGFCEQVKNIRYTDNEEVSPWVTIEKMVFGENLLIEWNSSTTQINSSMCEDIGASFIRLCDSVSKNASIWKDYIEVPLLEKEWELIEHVNQTDRKFEYQSLKSILEHSIKENREHIAIVCGENRYTYRDLEREAGKVKSYLYKNKILRNKSVALFLDKDEKQQIVAVGIILSGAVYVPLDTNSPLERTVQCLEECDAKILITSEEKKMEFQRVNIPVVTIESILQSEASLEVDALLVEEPAPDDIFDIVFTSGSTGKPKGVVSEQLGMTNHFLSIKEKLNMSSKDSIFAVTNYSHDVSFYESFGMFFYGGSVIIPAKKHQGAPHYWFDYMKKYKITFWFSVPTIMEMMLFTLVQENKNEQLEYFRVATIGGEFMPPDLFLRLRKIAPNIQLYNLGGATETSVYNLMHLVTKEDIKHASIPYGNPIWNTKYWILNDNLEVMPANCVGMICNSGINIARGYLDEDATKKSFILHPTLNERMYITGDLGSLREDGVFEIAGREDQQVKINGERIEISEISVVLTQHEAVKECVVLVIEDDVLGNENRIAAVLTLWDGHNSISIEELRKYAEQKLPGFMVPTIWKVMEELPQTRNNKIDNKLLSQLCREELNKICAIDKETEVEEVVLKICSGILGTEIKDKNKSFLEYGGHSLLIMKVLQAVRDNFGVEITFVEFYEEPTIAFLIRKIEERKALVEEQAPLFVFKEEIEKRYESFALNDLQMSYYLGQTEKSLGKTPTHMYMAIDGGNLDMERFQWSVNQLVRRHEALRCIICGNGEQRVLENVPDYVVEMVDVTKFSEEKKQEYFEKIAETMLYEKNDLKNFPNFTIKVVKISETSYTVCAVINCVMIDGGSISVLEDDLIKIYRGQELEPIDISLRDYTNNVLRIKETEQYKKSMDYWMSRMDTIPDAPALNVLAQETYCELPRVQHQKAFIEKEIYQRFVKNTKRHNITAVTGQIIAYALVLSRWSGSLHFTINIPTFNREFLHEHVQNLVGEFGSLIFLEVNMSKEDTIGEVGVKIQRQFMEDLDHHQVTGVDVIRNYAEQGKQWNVPIVFTSVTAQDERSMSRSDHVMQDWMTQSSKVWIDCIATEKVGGLEFVWDSCEGILDKKQVEEMFIAFKQEIIRLADPKEWKKTIFESVPVPNQKLVEKRNGTKKKWKSEPQLLHYGFYKNARQNAEKIACITHGEKVSYGKMYEMASGVATELQKRSEVHEEHVIICMSRGYRQVAAALGILFAQKAYLPTNIDWPKERIAKIIKKAEVKVVITTREDYSRVREMIDNGIEILVLEECRSDRLFEINEVQEPSETAYTIFTSGSTGEPKGVVIEHQGAVNTIQDVNGRYNINERDTAFSLSEICFDLSVYDIFGLLNAGGTVYILDAEEKQKTERWGEIIEREKITVWNTVPALAEMLTDYYLGEEKKFPELRIFMLSGDWIPLKLPEKIRKLSEKAEIISMGGATEASIWSIYYPIKEVKKEWSSIPYGYAMANQEMYVLNDAGQICPEGVPGNICIAGIGVAKGYMNDEEKTKESFVYHPYMKKRIYWTGDMGKYRDDGSIEFLGRLDGQVKINGYRIEMGEIESTASEYKGVNDAIAAVADKRILLYYTTDGQVQEEGLSEHIAQKVPHYMMPDIYVKIEEIPLSENGKVDRKKLPKVEVEEETGEKQELSSEYEEKLAEIYRQILDKKEIYRNTNFFVSGGNSVLAIRLIAKIKEVFQAKISVTDVFTYPVLADMAMILHENLREKEEQELPDIVADVENQYKPFGLNGLQQSYYIGRQESVELGNVPTHGYVELTCEKYDHKKFCKAVERLIELHDVLRCGIQDDGTQVIYKEVELPKIKVENVSNMSKAEREAFLMKKRQQIDKMVLDYRKPPLIYLSVTQIEDEKAIVHLYIDSLIVDGWSYENLYRDLDALYCGEIVKPLELSFRDYVIYGNSIKETKAYQKDKEYWQEKIKQLPEAPKLPMIQTPDMLDARKSLHIEKNLTEEQWNLINQIARENAVTAFNIAYTVFCKTIARYSQSKRFIINVPSAVRYDVHDDLQRMVGECSDFMILDYEEKPEESMIDTVKRNLNNLLEIKEHGLFTGTDIVREIYKKSSDYKSIVSPVVFSNNLDILLYDTKQLKMTFFSSRTSQVWIDVVAMKCNGMIQFGFDFVEGMFAEKMVNEITECFVETLRKIASDKNSINLKFEQLVSVPNQKLVEKLNGTKKKWKPEPQLLHYGFYKNARQNAEKTACITHGEKVSYGKMYEMASGVATELQKRSEVHEEHVIICMRRGYRQVAAALGILFAQKAYLPTNIDWPKERIAKIIKKAEVKVVITTREDYSRVREMIDNGIEILVLEECKSDKLFEINEAQEPSETAYTIFTSGSTGEPKGVVIEHQGAVNTIQDVNDSYNINEHDTAFSLSEICFDLSVYDIFGLLNAGGTVYIPDAEEKQKTERWGEIIEKEKITVWNTVPALAEMLTDYYLGEEKKFPELRIFMLSGDWIPLKLPEKIRKLSEKAEIISMGGATEASIWSIYYPIKEVKKEWSSIPYGYAMANQEMYVLNDAGQICPEGVPGNICIAGIGVAKGYMNDEEKTKESFVYHPYMKKRIYWTGDMGKYRDDGSIEFLGRLDGQVKINGYRIEMGEIESTASEYKGVNDAIAAVADKRIVLYYTTDGQVQEEGLSEHIAQKVPHYMMPDIYVKIEEIPLSENGKVDRKKLPKVEIEEEIGEKQELSGECEEKLAEIYRQILDKKDIYRNTNFFVSGGNSVLAIRLIAKIKEVFQAKISVTDVFTYPKLYELAKRIEVAAPYVNQEIQIMDKYSNMKFPLSYAQESMWFECMMEHSSRHSLAAYVDVCGVFDVEDMERALNITAQYYDLTKSVIKLDDNFDPYFTIVQELYYELNYKDISECTDKETELKKICQKEAEIIFDLEKGPLCNFTMIKLQENKYRIVIVMHHIISDDISIHLFMQEWFNNRNQVREAINDSNSVSIRTQKYIAHTVKEKERILDGEEKKFMQQLVDNSQMLQLPGTTYTERSEVTSANIDVLLEADLYEKFQQTCTKYKASLYMGFLAAFLIVLQRLSREEKITIGTPVSSRSSDKIDVIGLMINMEVIHADMEIKNDNFVTILEKISPIILSYIEENYIPFPNILKQLNAEDEKKHIPHHIVYNYLERQDFVNKDPNTELGELKYISNVVGHNLGLTVKIEKKECHCIFSYKTQYIASEMVENLANGFVHILKRIIENPEEKMLLGVEKND